MQAPREGGRTYSAYSFLNSAIDTVSGQRHAPAALCPWERTPDAHWTGGWVGLRPGVDIETREKFLACGGDQTPVVQSVVRHCTDGAYPRLFDLLMCVVK